LAEANDTTDILQTFR